MIRSALLALLFTSAVHGEIVYLNILHTNDIHGSILDGGALLASFVAEAERSIIESGEFMLLVDAGDTWQGTPVGNWDSGALVMEWMNAVGYDMMTPGNHDFDRGAPVALRNAALARFPVVCANFVTPEGETPRGIHRFIILDFDGVEVAFTGITTPDTRTLVDAAGLQGYDFTHEVQAVESVVAEVNDLGCQAIVLISHLGQPPNPEPSLRRVYAAWERGEEYTREFALNNAELTTVVSGIDVVISGHTHVALLQPWVNPLTGSVVVQGSGNGTGIGWLRLALERKTGRVSGHDFPMGYEFVNLLEEHFPPHSETAVLLESFRVMAEAGLDEVVGYSMAEIPRGAGEHPMGRMVSDAMLWSTGADVALINRGGIRASIPEGPVTVGSVYSSLPFEEDLFAFRVTGETLLSIMETGMMGQRRDTQVSGFTCSRNQAMPEGRRIQNPMVAGLPLEMEEEYLFVTTGYLAGGAVGYGILTGLEPIHTGRTLIESVLDYIRARSPLEPDYIARIRWHY